MEKMAMNNYLSTITLNVNGLNVLIKDRVAKWTRKHNPNIVCLQETQIRTKELRRLKVNG